MPKGIPKAGKRAEGAGRPSLPEDEKKRRVELFVNPVLAAFLDAEDLPDGAERNQTARRRKQQAADQLLESNIQSRML